MKTFKKAFAAIGALSLGLAPVAGAAQDTEMKPEVYQLLLDCGTMNLLASTGTEDAAEVEEYEAKALAFWRVGKAYGSADQDKLKTDTDASIERVGALVGSADDKALTDLISRCVGMEETVTKINGEMGS
ncbi:hypothetical protein [Paraurantiacibacter namhicola]|uniref:Uncharacterized protein n=1 Tax=Paraurantiacibacter namhicola TaxID=645517 RepID=A0A1C7D952_9SPHN|nr:hypothetical protein [Paraurantiacibacter namhicola]ANU08009.1 hypothetical protein A6F65_01712 [Paraurantiacibacter namhicola]